MLDEGLVSTYSTCYFIMFNGYISKRYIKFFGWKNSLFKKNILRIDGSLNEIKSIPENYDNFDDRKLKLIHYGGLRLKKYLSYNYNEEIDSAYITFWEYFCQTQFYKNNYVKYSNIHMAHLRRWLLQEREERKWHIEDSRKYSKNNYNRLLNLIVWIIPFKSLRDKIRNKYMINWFIKLNMV